MAGLISNGSFVLGDPNTRDLYLGTGLKDGFEGDKYYIAADETVLWEGNSTTNIKLSDSYDNYEYIKIYYSREENFYGRSSTELQCVDNLSAVISLVAANQANTNQYLYWNVISFNSNILTQNAGGYTELGTTTKVTTGRWLRITKVIGINRKRG